MGTEGFMTKNNRLEERVFSVFSDLAGTLGYSPVHGKIIGVLLVREEPVPLQELSRMTHYSASMVSLSLDLLEVLGVVRKIKKSGDRKLYVELTGDLLQILKKAVMVKLKQGIDNSLQDLREKRKEAEEYKGPEKEGIIKIVDILESEITRLEKYLRLLSGIKLPGGKPDEK